MKIRIYLPLFLAYLATGGHAHAGDVLKLIRMNLDSGGDNLLELAYTDGETAEIKAGQLFSFTGGIMYYPIAKPYVVEATISYKFDKVNAANGTAEFTRIPVDIVGLYRKSRHRFGGGITYHTNPTVNCGVSGTCSGKVKFDDAFGIIVQYGYGLTTGGGSVIDFGLRHTSIDYELDGESANGSSNGVFFGYAF